MVLLVAQTYIVLTSAKTVLFFVYIFVFFCFCFCFPCAFSSNVQNGKWNYEQNRDDIE